MDNFIENRKNDFEMRKEINRNEAERKKVRENAKKNQLSMRIDRV